ncbi:MAG: hypothetical protein FWD87_06650 [Spirochaetaceae bacterium]|nr:hypothetical protein [Spirochaetaceae bacterium]
MKNTFKILGIIALVMIIGFTITACNNSNDPPPAAGLPESEFSISGRFANAEGGNAYFQLGDARTFTPSASSLSMAPARSVTSASFAVSGVLKDDGIIFNLSGTYDPIALSFSVSAASSFMRYTINGAFDSNGNSIGSTATLAVRTGENWTTFTSPVDTTVENMPDLVGTAAEPETGGIPSNLRGFWHFSESDPEWGSFEGRMLVTQWNASLDMVEIDLDGRRYTDSITVTVIEVNGTNSAFDVILTYPLYRARNADELADAVLDFFNDKSIKPTRALSWDDITWGTGPQFYIGKNERDNYYYISWINFPENHWRLVDQYYRSGHEEAFLIRAGVPPTPIFEKNRVEVVQGNLKWSMYGTRKTHRWTDHEGNDHEDIWYDPMFYTLAAARAVTTLDLDNYIILRR